jgi:hypothetical protein
MVCLMIVHLKTNWIKLKKIQLIPNYALDFYRSSVNAFSKRVQAQAIGILINFAGLPIW